MLAVTGASSVPGLSSAVVAHHREVFARLDSIDIAISPGNAFDPGVATVASVLGGVGQPMRMLDRYAWRTVHGWQGLKNVDFGDAGRRWVGYVDVPDLDLFPTHDPNSQRFVFRRVEEAAPERAVGDEADAELAHGGEDLVLGIPAPERVLGLQGGDGMDRVRPADRGRRGLR